MKISLAHINTIPGDISGNLQKALMAYHKACDYGCDIIVYPELTLTGYIPYDLLNYSWFVEKNIKALNEFKKNVKNTAAVIGYVEKNTDTFGKKLKNAAAFIHRGKIIQKFYKKILPFSDIFYEPRYFEPETSAPRIIKFKGKKILITICADIWYDTDLISCPKPVPSSPLDCNEKYDMIINLSASPYFYGKIEKKLTLLKKLSKQKGADIVYVNICGSNENSVFDGTSFFISRDITFFTKPFEEGTTIINTSTTSSKNLKEDISFIEKAVILGIKDFFSKLNFEKAVIGLSGGIDSSVVCWLASKSLGNKNIKCLLLPSKFTSKQSIDDSIKLCRNLKLDYEIISIEEIYSSYLKTLNLNDIEVDLTIQNLQPRIRMNLLMAYSNKYGYILLNTSNKSEIALGYSTIYGDSAGALSPIGDILKTQIYDLAEFINSDNEIIPKSIVKRPPTAELKPNQKDQDDLPPYEVVDNVIKLYIEEKKDPSFVAKKINNPKLAFSIIKRIEANEYKRKQMPPIIKVSKCCFGEERKIPIVKKIDL